MADRGTPPVEVQPPASAKSIGHGAESQSGWPRFCQKIYRRLSALTTAFRFHSATSLRTVFRSIGERFWKTSNAIGRRMMTILMSILCVRESAVMHPRDPAIRGGGV